MHHRRITRREDQPSSSTVDHHVDHHVDHQNISNTDLPTASLPQQPQTRQSRQGPCNSIVSVGRRKSPTFVVGSIAVILVIHYLLLRPTVTFLLGPRGSPLGGVLGIFVDSQLRHYLFGREVKRWKNVLLKDGIVLPDADAPSASSSSAKLKTLPNYALGLTLLREARHRLDGGSVPKLTAQRNPSRPVLYTNSQHTYVTVTESPDAEPLEFVHKVSLQQQMKETGCEPSWLCFRCLKAPNYGSYSSCSFVCKACAGDIVCDSKDEEKPKKSVDMVVRVYRDESNGWLIPRIIHQTWFEELTPDKYPQLVRLQNSWTNSGWVYRFYSDLDVEQYIQSNFPIRFLRAYQSLTPGAYKADFFRYLVLMKDGGIYADVDVMLDTTLDAFVAPTMGFFVPLDAVGQQVDEKFCLWNGLIGSAPGHPYIIRAVERMMNLVLNRADLYDMEREICRDEKHMGETWKTRIEPNLLLSGPCALGVAVNEAIGRDPLSKFEEGLAAAANAVGSQNIPGDTLVLVLDKSDLGALRMSDVDRNLIVATTDMPGLNKDPIKPVSTRLGDVGRKGKVPGERPPHYSFAGKGDWLWGTKYVYSDDLTANELVRLKNVER
mmetsp:Transcript_23555/g.67846  ORF Transcript_23555/g.67846 Transcript_23555/m.67846 type:complete len:605 (+) Transcript_23555:93-1907(+)